MSGIDHQACCLAALLNELCKDFVENAQTTPTDKAVVESFIWPIFTRSISPLQTMLDDIDDPADDTRVINSGDSMR